MDRKLLFYLLGSVEDIDAKLSLRPEAMDKLTPNIQFNLDVVKRRLEGLRRSLAKEYAKTFVNEGASAPSDSPLG